MSDIPSAPVGSAPGPGRISVSKLTYVVEGRKLVDVENLNIDGRGPTVILGPNGAGKSLFVRLLHGLITPTSGQVLIDGVVPDRMARRGQAMVFQNPVLLRRSVAANIAYALKVHGMAQADRGARVAQLLQENGFQSKARQQARTLSGGEKQRLAIIRAMASNPSILFLDEPTSSLDPGASRDIKELVLNAARAGTKIVMITHDLGLARDLAENIVFLHGGRVCEQSPGEEFFNEPGTREGQAFLASNLALRGKTDG